MKLIIGLILILTQTTFASLSQPVPIPEDQSLAPQLEFAGVGIATIGYGKNHEHDNETGLNVSDSSFLFGASERLYDGAIGSFGFGSLTTDSVNAGSGNQSPYFIHQSFVDYQSEKFEAIIGRTDNQTAHIVDFPTIREEDLITLTNPLNPVSNGTNVEEHRYANVAAFTLNQNLTYFENIHFQKLINSAGIGNQTGINSVGITFEYKAPPGLEAFSRIPSWGLGYEHIAVDSANASSGLSQIFGGAIINLNESITNRWDLRFQEIVSTGSQLSSFSNINDSFEADSQSLAMALRYLNSPFGGAGYQVSLTAAYKDYFKVKQAKSAGLALTGVKRLGGGFNLITQYQTQWRDTALSAAQTNNLAYENIFELGLSFNFDAIVNRHLSPRRTLLNQQHNYISN